MILAELLFQIHKDILFLHTEQAGSPILLFKWKTEQWGLIRREPAILLLPAATSASGRRVRKQNYMFLGVWDCLTFPTIGNRGRAEPTSCEGESSRVVFRTIQM